MQDITYDERCPSGDLCIEFKSGRKSIYKNVYYFYYFEDLDVWCVGSKDFRGHDKQFSNSKVKFIYFLKGDRVDEDAKKHEKV